MTLSDYDMKKKCGQGAQGAVYRAIHRPTGETVAVKQIDVSNLSVKERVAVLSEVKVLQALSETPHPYVMGYRESFVEDGNLNIVLEWSSSGTLQDMYQTAQEKRRRLEEDEIWHYFLSVALALLHVHRRNILHRDVKMANIFLHSPPATTATAGNDGKRRSAAGQSSLPCVRLGDFGVSTILDDRSRANTVVGTPYYLSPELCMGKAYSNKSDVWSLGVVLFMLLNNKMPFEASNYAALILRIVQQEHAKHAKDAASEYSATLLRMATWCMMKDESQRPAVRDIVSHPDCVRKALQLGLVLPEFILRGACGPRFGAPSGVDPAELARKKDPPARKVVTTVAKRDEEQVVAPGTALLPSRRPLTQQQSSLRVPRKQRIVTGQVNSAAIAAMQSAQRLRQQQALASGGGSRPAAGVKKAEVNAVRRLPEYGEDLSDDDDAVDGSTNPSRPAPVRFRNSSGIGLEKSDDSPTGFQPKYRYERQPEYLARRSQLESSALLTTSASRDERVREHLQQHVRRSEDDCGTDESGGSPFRGSTDETIALLRRHNLLPDDVEDEVMTRPVGGEGNDEYDVNHLGSVSVTWRVSEEVPSGSIGAASSIPVERSIGRDEDEKQQCAALDANTDDLGDDCSDEADGEDRDAYDDEDFEPMETPTEGPSTDAPPAGAANPLDTSSTPLEVFSSPASIEAAVNSLFDDGEHLVGPRVFAELVEVLSREKPLLGPELEAFAASRVPHEKMAEAMYLCFRYILLSGERTRQMAASFEQASAVAK